MNYFLLINKKIILVLIFLIIFLVTIFFIFEKIKINSSQYNVIKKDNTDNYDITKPKFTINNQKNKISVTANQGNFIDEEIILLQNNVSFKSKRFEIFSNKVFFNQKTQTAESNDSSTFLSEGTKIVSEGFNIYENGDLIEFTGKSSLILTK